MFASGAIRSQLDARLLLDRATAASGAERWSLAAQQFGRCRRHNAHRSPNRTERGRRKAARHSPRRSQALFLAGGDSGENLRRIAIGALMDCRFGYCLIVDRTRSIGGWWSESDVDHQAKASRGSRSGMSLWRNHGRDLTVIGAARCIWWSLSFLQHGPRSATLRLPASRSAPFHRRKARHRA